MILIGIFRDNGPSRIKNNFTFALRAMYYRYLVCILSWLHYGFYFIMKTIGAKVMRRLAVCHRFNERINRSGIFYEFKFISNGLFWPCFYFHNILFKLVYFCNERRLFLLRFKCALLRGEKGILQFDELPLDFCERFIISNCRNYIFSGFNVFDGGCDFLYHDLAFIIPPNVRDHRAGEEKP